MRILVTGSTGFLGSSLVNELGKSSEIEIIAIGNNSPQTESHVVFHKVDITDSSALKKAAKLIGNVDALVHMAAAVPRTLEEDDVSKMIDVNIQGTVNLLGAFSGKCPLLVLGSTAEVYGLKQFKGIISENQATDPLSYYGATKLASEVISKVFCARNDMELTILRFSVMYGKGDPINRAIPNFIKCAINDLPISVYGGEELRDYLHVDDAVQAIVCALNSKTSGTYNVGTGIGISIAQSAKEIVKTTNSKSKIVLLPRQKPASDIVLNCTAAETGIGFKAKHTFPEGIEKQISWSRQT